MKIYVACNNYDCEPHYFLKKENAYQYLINYVEGNPFYIKDDVFYYDKECTNDYGWCSEDETED